METISVQTGYRSECWPGNLRAVQAKPLLQHWPGKMQDQARAYRGDLETIGSDYIETLKKEKLGQDRDTPKPQSTTATSRLSTR